MTIYIYKNNQQHGPYQESTVFEWFQNGQCSPTDLGRRENGNEWQPLSKLLFEPAGQMNNLPQPPLPPFAAPANNQMNLLKGLTYIFEDRDWVKKTLIGSVITAIPVVEAITNGYQMKVIENIKSGNPRPLPEWDNVGAMFGKGIVLWLAVNLFYIPSAILSVLGFIVGLSWLGRVISLLIDADWKQAQLINIILLILQAIVAGLLTLCTFALPLAFIVVPVMALRCAETGSFFSTMNVFGHLKFVFKHLGDYVLARISVVIMVTVVGSIGSVIGGVTIWTVIGALLGWVIIGTARFWGRLMWSYYLAHMRLKEV